MECLIAKDNTGEFATLLFKKRNKQELQIAFELVITTFVPNIVITNSRCYCN